MDIERKAKRLLKAVDNVYTVPTYLEDRVKKAIMLELKEMGKNEKVKEKAIN